MLRHIPFVGSLFVLVCGLTMHLIRALALQCGKKLIRLCWTSKYCANKSGVGTSSSEKFNLPKQGEQYITECQCHSIVMQIGLITATSKFKGRDDWFRHTLTMKKTHGAAVKLTAQEWLFPTMVLCNQYKSLHCAGSSQQALGFQKKKLHTQCRKTLNGIFFFDKQTFFPLNKLLQKSLPRCLDTALPSDTSLPLSLWSRQLKQPAVATHTHKKENGSFDPTMLPGEICSNADCDVALAPADKPKHRPQTCLTDCSQRGRGRFCNAFIY